MAVAFSDREKFDVRRAYKDASQKVAALEGRQKDEYEQAEAEDREPLPIEPLTGIPANIVCKAIGGITGDVSTELSEVLAVQRKSCALHGTKTVYLLSSQLKMILDAAGLGEPDAQVQGQ